MEHAVKYLNAKEADAMVNLDLDIKEEEYTQVCTSERKMNKGNLGESIPVASKS